MTKMQCQMAANCDEVRCPSRKPHDKTDLCEKTCSVHARSTCIPVYREYDVKVVIADIVTTMLDDLREVGVCPFTGFDGEWEERYHALRAETSREIESLKEQIKILKEKTICLKLL